jgi:hypothetical protein
MSLSPAYKHSYASLTHLLYRFVVLELVKVDMATLTGELCSRRLNPLASPFHAFAIPRADGRGIEHIGIEIAETAEYIRL